MRVSLMHVPAHDERERAWFGLEEERALAAVRLSSRRLMGTCRLAGPRFTLSFNRRHSAGPDGECLWEDVYTMTII